MKTPPFFKDPGSARQSMPIVPSPCPFFLAAGALRGEDAIDCIGRYALSEPLGDRAVVLRAARLQASGRG